MAESAQFTSWREDRESPDSARTTPIAAPSTAHAAAIHSASLRRPGPELTALRPHHPPGNRAISRPSSAHEPSEDRRPGRPGPRPGGQARERERQRRSSTRSERLSAPLNATSQPSRRVGGMSILNPYQRRIVTTASRPPAEGCARREPTALALLVQRVHQ